MIMTQQELSRICVGETLDSLMNFEARGYGVCRILYEEAKRRTHNYPLSMHMAQKLLSTLSLGDTVFVISGFILPCGKPETDGIVGSIFLCRALMRLGIRTALICPDDCTEPVRKMCASAGIAYARSKFEDVGTRERLIILPFTKIENQASSYAKNLLSLYEPKAVISIEAPGRNIVGVYHNASGLDISHMQARSDVLFAQAYRANIPTFAIGDLGNEMGLGKIASHIKKYIPYCAHAPNENTCACGCGKGICAESGCEDLLTASVSDFGTYAVISAISFICGDLSLLHTPEDERRMLRVGVESGLVNMDGTHTPAIDGYDEDTCANILFLMRQTVEMALEPTESSKRNAERTILGGYFSRDED